VGAAARPALTPALAASAARARGGGGRNSAGGRSWPAGAEDARLAARGASGRFRPRSRGGEGRAPALLPDPPPASPSSISSPLRSLRARRRSCTRLRIAADGPAA
jgi:hypothetical protein